MHILLSLLIPICAIANRGRGSQLFGITNSTVVGRLVSMALIAMSLTILTSNALLLPITFAGLMLWCTPAWDSYWSAEIGDSAHSKLWGCCMMFLRQLLIVPMFAAQCYLTNGNYYFISTASIYWLPYFLYGIFIKEKAVQYSEYTIGGLIGLTEFFICQTV